MNKCMHLSRRSPSVMTNLSEPSEADNKNVISVCPTCGSDDPKVLNDPCDGWGDIDVAQEPDPFHPQGSP